MANTIKLKRGSGSDPGTSDLSVGELAIRTDTALLFTKNDGGSVVPIGISDGDKGDITVSSNGGTFTIDSGVVTSAKIANDTIVNADINSSAAIDGSKISPAFTSDITGTGNLTLTSTDAGSSAAPELELYRNSSSPADADYLGQLKFTGESDDGSKEVYAKVTGKIDDASSGTEDGIIEFAHRKAGSNVITGRFKSTEFQLLNGTGLSVNGNISTDGTVDGRDVAADGTKLDGIESGATADQTKSDIDALGIAASTAATLATARTIAGVSFDGSANISLNNNAITNGAGYITATLTQEQVEDYVGGMVTGNTETGITVTYDDSDGTLDFVVASQTENDFTTTLKNKLDGIAASAIANVVEDTSPQLGGDLDVQSSKITTATSNGNVKIEPDGTGVVEVRGAGGNDGKLQLNCSAQSHGIILASPAHSAGQSYTLIFPDNQIAADKYLKIKSISGSGSTAIGQAEYASLDANDLGEGTIPDARFPSTLPALNGSALTNLNGSNIASGTIAAARVATLNQDTTGSAATLTTARNIGGVSFDGSANINLPGVNTSGNQDTSGNAATATALETARTIAGVSFDGTANISLNNNAITNGAGYITATLTNEQVQDIVGGMLTGNTETGITVTYQDGDGTIDFVVGTLNQDTTGNAATATALETARNIGGVSFDGTANINLPGVNTSGSQDTSGTAAIATTVTVADESSDTTCFPLFATAATGNLAPKSGSNLAFNSSNGTLTATAFSGDGSALTGISAGATGGGSDEIFYENGQNVTTDYTITNGKNAMSAGPITIDSGVTVTVGAGETLTIV